MHVHSGGDGNRDELLTVDEKMAKSLFNQVFLESDFVLKTSHEIKNQSLVSYLNSIYNPMVEARTSNYLDEVLFLIANLFLKMNYKMVVIYLLAIQIGSWDPISQ